MKRFPTNRVRFLDEANCVDRLEVLEGPTGRRSWPDEEKILRQHGFRASMSGTANCYDNAAVETFFKTIKAELLWQKSWKTRRDAEIAMFEYINRFYNPRRRHSALGWKSPVAFERKVA